MCETLSKGGNMPRRAAMTRPQKKAIRFKWSTNRDGAPSYRSFFCRWQQGGIGTDCYLMGHWCGMWVGIEQDGYAHT